MSMSLAFEIAYTPHIASDIHEYSTFLFFRHLIGDVCNHFFSTPYAPLPFEVIIYKYVQAPAECCE